MKHLILLLPLFFFINLTNGQDIIENSTLDSSKSNLDSVIVDYFIDSNSVVHLVYGPKAIRNFTIDTLNGYIVTTRTFCGNGNKPNNNYIPLLKTDNNIITIENKQLRILAVRNINEVVNTTAGIQLTTNGLSFRGSRENGTAY